MPEGQNFRHKFLPAYVRIMGCTFPIAVLGAVVDLGLVEHPWKSAAFLAFILILGAVLTLTWTRTVVTVAPAGVNCYTSAGASKFAEWDSMISIQPTRILLGLPYLRILRMDGGSPLWLPLYLNDMPRFVDLVSSYAGVEHPLAVALQAQVRA